MNRKSLILLGVVLVLLVANIIYRVWAGWGLITVHAKAQPLGKVIASIERQGHAVIETDIPADTLISMDVTKVTLPDALETLATCSEGRWRLLYFVAGDKAAIKTAETSWTASGQRPDGWKMVSFPIQQNLLLGAGGDDDDGLAAPPDPRHDIWTPKTAAGAPVQDFMTEAAQMTNAGFAFPESWNPNVRSAPAPGEVAKAVPKLISAAGGKEEQVFFLSKPFQRRQQAGGQAGATTTDGTPRMDPDAIATRVQNQINQLPPDKRAIAQANFDRERAFWMSVVAMSPEDRRAAIQQHLQDPEVQQQIINRVDGQDARMGHQQRLQHFQNYVQRKLAAQGKN